MFEIGYTLSSEEFGPRDRAKPSPGWTGRRSEFPSLKLPTHISPSAGRLSTCHFFWDWYFFPTSSLR